MGTGDDDRAPLGRDRREDIAAAQHRDLALVRRANFGVVIGDRRADRHEIGGADVGGGVTDVNLHARDPQSFDDRTTLQIAAGDGVPHTVKHVGDRAHARAAGTDKVDVVGFAQVRGHRGVPSGGAALGRGRDAC